MKCMIKINLVFLITFSALTYAAVQTNSGEIAESEFFIDFNASELKHTANEPCILFDKTQLAELKQSVTAAKMQPIWQEVLAKAENYCDSKSNEYVSTKWVADMPGRWLAMHGRNLSGYLEIIGLAYHITGEEKFAKHGAALLTEAAVSLPTTHSGIASGKALGGARGDMLRVFATGLDLFGEVLTDNQMQTIRKTVIEYLEGVYQEEGGSIEGLYKEGDADKLIIDAVFEKENPRVHNFSAVIWGSAGALGFHFVDTNPVMAENIIKLSTAIVKKYLYDAYADGAAMEGTSYVGYAFSNIFLLADVLKRFDIEDIYAHPNITKLIYFHSMILLPGEDVYDPRSSAEYGSGSTITMLKLARELGSSKRDRQPQNFGRIARFLANFGVNSSAMRVLYESNVEPLNPADVDLPFDVHFQKRGLVVFRTGWDKDDIMFSIEAGRHNPGSHGYADNGHITLYGLGRRWLRDPGTRNHPTQYFNCVLVNGIGQGLSGRGYGTSSEITDYKSQSLYGYCKADLTEAYKKGGSPTNPVPGLDMQKAIRHCYFVRSSQDKPAYIVVLDDMKLNDSKNEFSFLLHTSSEMASKHTDKGILVEPVDATGGSFIACSPAEGDGMVGWRFNVDKTQEYAIWARVKANRDSYSVPRAGSFTIQIDDLPQFDWLLPTTWQQEWIWTPVRRSDFALPQLPPDLGDDLHKHVIHGSDDTLRQIGSNWHNFKSIQRYFPQRDLLAQRFTLNKGAHLIKFMPRSKDNEPAYLDSIVITADTAAKPPFDLDCKDLVVLESDKARRSGSFKYVEVDSGLKPMMFVAGFSDQDLTVSEDTHLFRPRISLKTTAVNPRFAVVMMPIKGDTEIPDISYEKGEEKTTITIKWQEQTDQIQWFTDTAKSPIFLRN